MKSAVIAFLSLLLAGQSNAQDILCPGKPSGEYCDCEGDCTGHPEFCSCEEAQACCKDATPTVLCPGKPSGEYCDCEGDCTDHPEFCSCEEAQACCEDATPAKSTVSCPGWIPEKWRKLLCGPTGREAVAEG